MFIDHISVNHTQKKQNKGQTCLHVHAAICTWHRVTGTYHGLMDKIYLAPIKWWWMFCRMTDYAYRQVPSSRHWCSDHINRRRKQLRKRYLRVKGLWLPTNRCLSLWRCRLDGRDFEKPSHCSIWSALMSCQDTSCDHELEVLLNATSPGWMNGWDTKAGESTGQSRGNAANRSWV